MARWGRTCVVLVWALVLLPSCGKAWAQSDDKVACDRAARDAETEFGLPAGMLKAIGSVESSHWPWSANIDGAAETYRSKAEAIMALTRVRTLRSVDIDVGCFQVSLRYHPSAFPTLADALDPTTNAHYAARFLSQLHDRYGNWNQAVGAYHSATGPLGADYRDRVIAQWKGIQPPVVEQQADQPRWRVISIASELPRPLGPHALPHIITLGN